MRVLETLDSGLLMPTRFHMTCLLFFIEEPEVVTYGLVKLGKLLSYEGTLFSREGTDMEYWSLQWNSIFWPKMCESCPTYGFDRRRSPKMCTTCNRDASDTNGPKHIPTTAGRQLSHSSRVTQKQACRKLANFESLEINLRIAMVTDPEIYLHPHLYASR